MPYWRVWNKSEVVINAAISWADEIRYCTNHLAPGGYDEWEVDSLGWVDLTAVIANSETFRDTETLKVGQDLWNVGGQERNWIATALDFPNRPLAVFSFRAPPSLAPGTIASQETLTALDRIYQERLYVGATFTLIVGACLFDDGARMGYVYPVTARGLYAPHGYNTEFSGVRWEITLREDLGQPKINARAVLQLKATCRNNTTEQIYEYVGDVVN